MTPARTPDGRHLVAVALGGVLGSLGRYAVGLALPHPTGGWPWSTAVVNLTGCLAMGLLLAFLVERPGTHHLARPFLAVGVLGGWTTYSAFAAEVVAMLEAGRAGLATVYALGSVLLGALAVGAGRAAGQRFWREEEPA